MVFLISVPFPLCVETKIKVVEKVLVYQLNAVCNMAVIYRITPVFQTSSISELTF